MYGGGSVVKHLTNIIAVELLYSGWSCACAIFNFNLGRGSLTLPWGEEKDSNQCDLALVGVSDQYIDVMLKWAETVNGKSQKQNPAKGV